MKKDRGRMGFSLYNLFKAGLLVTNAGLILNRGRFLAKYRLDDASARSDAGPLLIQAIGLLQAIQYLKVPVIAANCLVVFFELILGGT